MSNINELKPIISLNPFARFCCTIGNLPSSYMASLTYEEQLLWFCDYLQNTIIPAVNNNAEVVKELQELYVKLKNYVDNYFENLDVQNEINNKLDEMAEDGTLENIINQEIFGNINNQISNINNIITFNEKENYSKSGLSVHISFDDVTLIWEHLKANSYNSIFEEPLLNLLKYLHDNYNACFSLYVFTDTFNNLNTSIYKNEFKENSNWLKIGYHGLNSSDNLTNISYKEAKNRYNLFVSNVLKICETNRIIDRVPRLANYIAPSYCITGLTDANCGIIGVLDAEDTRTSYDHNSLEVARINNQFEYFSNITNLFYIKTNIRLENIQYSDLNIKLNSLLNSSNSTNRNIEIFTHEQHIIEGTTIIEEMKNKLIICCEFFNNNNIPFNFVENKLPNLTGSLLSSNITLSPKSIGSVSIGNEEITNIYSNSLDNIKNGIDIHASNCNFVYSSSSNNFNKCAVNGLIRARGNKIVNLWTSLDNLQYSIIELTCKFNRLVNKTENGMNGTVWKDFTKSSVIQDTLQNETFYYLIKFKYSDESLFSHEDLLKNKIVVW